MTRKHTRRRVIVPLPPRGLRPKLKPDQLRDLAICHLTNLDAIARGDATVDNLWQVLGAALTWSRVAGALRLGMPEAAVQLQLVGRVMERFSATGRVVFTGPEYQLAKHGVEVMDELAAQVDRHTAVAAAEWSEAELQRVIARHQAQEPRAAA